MYINYILGNIDIIYNIDNIDINYNICITNNIY